VRPMTNEQLRYIFLEIINGRGNHGSFLRAFSEALILADDENFAMMKGIAVLLVEKYNLYSYLEEKTDESQAS
jgi:hypothetical protein